MHIDGDSDVNNTNPLFMPKFNSDAKPIEGNLVGRKFVVAKGIKKERVNITRSAMTHIAGRLLGEKDKVGWFSKIWNREVVFTDENRNSHRALLNKNSLRNRLTAIGIEQNVIKKILADGKIDAGLLREIQDKALKKDTDLQAKVAGANRGEIAEASKTADTIQPVEPGAEPASPQPIPEQEFKAGQFTETSDVHSAISDKSDEESEEDFTDQESTDEPLTPEINRELTSPSVEPKDEEGLESDEEAKEFSFSGEMGENEEGKKQYAQQSESVVEKPPVVEQAATLPLEITKPPKKKREVTETPEALIDLHKSDMERLRKQREAQLKNSISSQNAISLESSLLKQGVESYSANERELLDLLSPKMLGHVLGDFMLGGTNLEGGSGDKALGYLTTFLTAFKEEMSNDYAETFDPLDLDKIILAFQEAKNYAGEIERLERISRIKDLITIQEEIKNFAEKTLNKFKKLRDGESFLMTGGWSGVQENSGHGLLYLIEKKGDKYNFSIINTGAGAETHNYILHGTKRKFNPVRQFSGLEIKEGQIDLNFLQASIEMQILPLTKEEKKYDQADIYGPLIEKISEFESKLNAEEQDMITGQRAGTCTFKSAVIALRVRLKDKKAYKIIKHVMQLRALTHAVQNLKEGKYQGDDEFLIINVLERASRKIIKSAHKSKSKHILNSEQSRIALETAQDALMQIKAYRAQSFQPFVAKIKPKETSVTPVQKLREALENEPIVNRPDLSSFDNHFIVNQLPILEVSGIKDASGLVDAFEKFSTTFDSTSSIYSPSTLLHFLSEGVNQIDLDNSQWKEILIDKDLASRMLSAINKINSSVVDLYNRVNYSRPEDIPNLLKLYRCTTLLIKATSPSLEGCGVDLAIFKNLQKELFCKDVFGTQFSKDLNGFEIENEDRKFVLFQDLEHDIDLSKPENFEAISDLRYLENLLMNHPSIEEKIELSVEQKEMALNSHLGLGEESKIRRFKALLLFTSNKLPVSKNIHGYKSYSSYEKTVNIKELIPEIIPYIELRNIAWLCKFHLGQKPGFLANGENIGAGNLSFNNPYKRKSINEINLEFLRADAKLTNSVDRSKFEKALSKNQKEEKKSSTIINPEFELNPNFWERWNIEANEIQTINSGGSNNLQIERDLNLIGSESDLQISHLLDYVASHPDFVQNPKNQLVLQSRLLDSTLLIQQIKEEPELVDQIISFIHGGIRGVEGNASREDEILSQLFFIRLNQRLLNYLAIENIDKTSSDYRLIEESQNKFKEMNKKFREDLKKMDLSLLPASVRMEFYQTLLFIHQNDNTISDQALADLCQVIAYSKFEKKTVGDDSLLLGYESEKVLIQHSEQLKHLMDDPKKGSDILNSILVANHYSPFESAKLEPNSIQFQQFLEDYRATYGAAEKKAKIKALKDSLPEETWLGSYPTFTLIDNTKNFLQVNVLTGEVMCNGTNKSEIQQEILKSPEFSQLFQSKSFPFPVSPLSSDGLEGYYQEKKIRFVRQSTTGFYQDYKTSIFLEHKEKEWLKLMPKKNSVRANLPAGLMHSQNNLWQIVGEKEEGAAQQFTIYDRSLKNPICNILSNGEIVKVENSEHHFLYLDDIPQYSYLNHFGKTNRISWGVPGDSNPLKELKFPGLLNSDGSELLFENDENGNMRLSNDKEFFISHNQMLHSLRGCKEYLLLENDKGERKVIIPHALSTLHHQDQSYFLFSLSPLESIQANNTTEDIQLAITDFQRGDYCSAIDHLKASVTSVNYTKEQLAMFQFFADHVENGEDPLASSARILAISICVDNLRSKALHLREKKSLSSSVKDESDPEEVLLKALEKIYPNLLSNQNIPVGYHPEELLGKDREIRLISLLKEKINKKEYSWEPSPGRTLSPTLEEHFLKITQNRFSDNQNIIYGGTFTEPDRGFIKKPNNYQMSPEKIIEILSPQHGENKENLTRPGDAFVKNFRKHWNEAISKDENIRKQLRDRILAMRYEDHEQAVFLAKCLIAAIYCPSYRIPTLPDENDPIFSASNMDKSEYFFKITQKLKDLIKSSYVIDSLSTVAQRPRYTSDIQEVLVNTTIPARQKRDFEESVKFLDMPLVSKEIERLFEISKPLQKSPEEEGSTPLFNENWLEQLQQKHQFPPYVLNELSHLNKVVTEKNLDLADIYTLKEDASIEEVERIFNQQYHQDYEERASLIEESILTLVNKEFDTDEENLELSLLRESHLEKSWNIETCITTYLHSRWDLLEDKNPPLTPEEIQEFHALMTEYFLVNIRAKQTKRALSLIEEVKHLSKNERSYTLKVQELGEIVFAKRSYDYHTSPAMLVFEYASDFLIRPSQAKALNEIFATDETGKSKNVILQLIMGGGKSKVISPIQAQMKADGKQLSLLVVPDFSFEGSKIDLERTSFPLFKQHERTLEFSREDTTIPYLKTVLSMLKEAINHKEYVTTRPKDLLCLELAHWDVRSQRIRNSYNNELIEKAELLREIVNLITRTGNITYDEVDTIFRPEYQVNLTLGNSVPPNKDAVSTINNIYRILFSDPQLRKMVRLHENKQSLTSEAEMKIVLDKLAERLIDDENKKCQIPVDRDLLKAYVLENDEQKCLLAYSQLLKLYESNETEICAALDRMSILKEELSSLLSKTLSKSGDVSYGLSNDHPEEGCAIPYSASNTPKEGSQFSQSLETMNKTFQLFCSKWPNDEQTIKLIAYYKEKLTYAINDREKKTIQDEFFDLTGIDLTKVDKDQIERTCDVKFATKQLNDKIQSEEVQPFVYDCISEYLTQVIYPQQMKVYQQELNGTVQDLSGMTSRKSGYSGTLGSQRTFPKEFKCLPNEETDRETIRALKRDNSPIFETTTSNPGQFIEDLLKNHKHPEKVRAIIDIGAQFRGKSNIEIAKALLENSALEKENIEAVLFWDGKLPTLLARQTGKTYPLKGTSKTDIQKVCKQYGINAEQIFTFYDEGNIIGSDIPQIDQARGIVTLSEQTSKDSLLQGVMRMRGLIKGTQHIEFAIDKEVKSLISQALYGVEKDLTINDVINYCALTQAKNELRAHFVVTAQQMTYAVKKFYRQKISDSEDEDAAQYMFEQTANLFITIHENKLFKKYGLINKEVDVRDALEDIKKSLLDKIPKSYRFEDDPKILSVELDAIIKSQYEALCLPEKVKTGLAVGLESQKIQEQKTEQRVEQRRENEIKQEDFKNILKTPYLEPEPVEGDLFKKDYPFAKQVKLDTLLQEDPEASKCRGLLSSSISITENFMKSCNEQPNSLFSSSQKPMTDILVAEENGVFKYTVVSNKEAKFYKKEIAKQKKSGVISPNRNLWLISPNGRLVQSGAAAWDKENPKFKKVHIELLLLSGNVHQLNSHIDEFEKWLKGDNLSDKEIAERIEQTKILLTCACQRSILDQQKFGFSKKLKSLLKIA